MLGRFRSVSNTLWLALASAVGCAEAATIDELDELDSSYVLVESGVDAGDALDADLSPWLDASALYDSSLPALDASPGVDAGTDAGSSDAGSSDAGSSDAGSSDAGSSDAGRNDAGSNDAGARDAGTDAGPRDAGSDASTADAGKADSGTPDSGSNMCSPDTCKNDCSIAAPFRCCQQDGQCGCSWVSGIYCN